MVIIVPAIIESTVAAVQAKLDRVAHLVSLAHIDVADGMFVSNDVLDDPGFLDLIKTDADIELHLMIELPEVEIEQWNHAKIKRFIVHQEAMGEMNGAIEKMKTMGKEIFIALNPETMPETIESVINDIDGVVCMGVYPGYGGQQLIESVVYKVQELRQLHPNLLIAVDGGVRFDNAKRLIDAGANQLVIGTALFEAEDIGDMFERFKSL